MSDGRLPRQRRWVGWALGIVLTCLVLLVGWVTVRGIGAVESLQRVADGAAGLKSAIAEGDLERAADISDTIAIHAASARDLTADPVWQGFGYVPWLGPNFRAVSDIAVIADDVAQDALEPMLAAAADIDLTSLGFRDGAIDLGPLGLIQAPLETASETLDTALDRAVRIDADATLPPLADAVGEMRAAVTEAATVVGTLHGASVLLPSMLGANGPRFYVLAMQNNAELRSSGGIVGSVALLRAENGRISLERQASAVDFPPLEAPLTLSESTVALFEDGPGRYLQNLSSIPDFTEAGPAIATRWQGVFGGTVDGVVAVDAVVAAHLTDAVGPLSFGPFTATADDVVRILLSDIYATIPDPVVQDQVFAQAAAGLFGAALTNGDAPALLEALTASAGENRIRIWSAHEEEQRVLADSSLSGAIPADGDDESHVGVLYNDTTGGKMDFYARQSITTAIGTCEGEPTTQIRVTFTNDAPADAATTLPPYVTGGEFYGVPAGTIRTLVAVYGPEGASLSHADRDGTEEPVQTAMIGSRSTVQHDVLLAPGESSTITVEFQGTGAGERLTRVVSTPTIEAPDTTREELRCAS
ncbi:DUF4012 domain-containing protein [Microbacterium sp. 179-I 3D4 NHS]|uniref:DUF4012 domain-containing protein n=1 Tax=Microbacterium sp. 179-I 3D4 NHS TaxID=3142381 RepID=UPI00399FCEBE